MGLELQIFLVTEVLTLLKREGVQRQSLSATADKVFRAGTTELQLLAVAMKPELSPGVRPAGQRPSRAISKETLGDRPPLKPEVLTVQAGVTKGHSVHLQRAAEISDLLKIQEGPSAAQIDPSALHLPAVVALLAQTATAEAVRSDAAAAGVAQEASQEAVLAGVEASPVVVPVGVGASPVVVPQVVAAEAVVTVGVEEAVDRSWLIKSTQKRIIRSSFFILSLTGIAEPCKFI